MNASFGLRLGLIWTGLTLLALVGLLILAVVALDAGYLRGPLVKWIASHTNRPIRVDGPLIVHILSRHPRLVAERVTIGSPPWTPAGDAAEVGKITMVFATPRLGQELIIDRLTIEKATLHFYRDVAGHANWQLENPDKSAPQGLPVIHALTLMDAHVQLVDEQKSRQFDGTVSANDAKVGDGAQALRIEGKGQLNGRPVSFELTGDPLRSASRDQRYAFSFSERSSGSRLAGKGFLRHAFDVRAYDAAFEASGADLRDMYYLTGTRLIDTGSYHLSGKLAWRAFTSSFTDLLVTTGQSDVGGSVSIDSGRGQVNVDADLNSQSLRLSDFGARAAGRDPDPEANRMLFSRAAPDPKVLRRGRAAVKFQARRVEAGRVVLSTLEMRIANDHGELSITPLSAQVMGGKLNGEITIDTRKETPAVRLEVRIIDLQLGQYAREKAGPPAIEGPLELRMNLSGQGKSMHEVAAHVDGTVTARLPSGMVRDSLAELTGIDLRGLGLLLTKNQKEVPVRCGVANFQAHDGTLTAKDLVLDTAPVLITGEGLVHLDTETLDLMLRGYPKNVRFLQLRSPIVIRGTIKAPSFAIQAHDSKLVLVDPGKAKDADCGALLH